MAMIKPVPWRIERSASNRFSRITSNLLALTKGCCASSRPWSRPAIYRQAMGSIAEEAFWGGVDLREAGLQLERILAA